MSGRHAYLTNLGTTVKLTLTALGGSSSKVRVVTIRRGTVDGSAVGTFRGQTSADHVSLKSGFVKSRFRYVSDAVIIVPLTRTKLLLIV